MARNKLKQLAEEFVGSTKWLADYSKVYHVDYLFPSLGVVDLITSHLRANFTLTEDDKKLLHQSAAFLTEYAVQCWEECGLTCDIAFDENGSLIAIRGLQAKPIHLQSIFAMFLAKAPSDVYIDGKNKIPLSPKGDFVCSFMQGFLRGAYFERSVEVDNLFSSDFGETLDRVIARQYGSWHEVVFPELKLAHLPELYLFSLRNRHFLASDEAPMVKEVSAFVEYFNNLGIDPATAGVRLGALFLNSPSEYLSLLGIVLLGAVSEKEELSDSSLANIKVRSYACPMLSTAFYKYKQLIGLEADWMQKENIEASDRIVIEREQQMGLSPWMVLDPKYIVEEYNKNKNLKEFCALVRKGDFFSSQTLLDEMLELNPSDLMLRTQRAYYFYVTSGFEMAHEYCKQLLSEPNIEKNYQFFNTWGMILLSMKRVELAIRYLKLAYGTGGLALFRKAEIGNNLSWCYLLEGANELAKPILEEIQQYSSPEVVSILLNHLFISEVPEKGISEDLLKALSLAPMDRRVFNNLVLMGRARVEGGELKV